MSESNENAKNEQVKSAKETTASIREYFENKPKSKLILAIISDAVLFSRLSSKMFDILNVFDPKNGGQDFELEMHYNGMNNALSYLKIKDENLENILGEIYNELIFFSSKKDFEVNDLAELIYFKWLKAIKKYNSSYS